MPIYRPAANILPSLIWLQFEVATFGVFIWFDSYDIVLVHYYLSVFLSGVLHLDCHGD